MIVHITQRGKVMFLPLNTHLGRSRTNTWPLGSQIINSHVTVCSLNFSSFKRSHLDSIEFGPHGQTNLQQAQNHMARMCECGESYEKG
jgi:hypothetical protein